MESKFLKPVVTLVARECDVDVPSSDYKIALQDRNVEDIESYRPGGYHPIDIGDRLSKPRTYVIERKLGFGRNSTVWLVRHELLLGLRAVKVFRSNRSSANALAAELKIVNKLKDLHPKNRGHDHILEPEMIFPAEGPNGTHECVVYPVTQGRIGRRQAKFSPGAFKSLVKQSLKVMTLIHKTAFVHNDFHLGNIHFDTRNISDHYSAADGLKLYPLNNEQFEVQVTKDQNLEQGYPKYLYCGLPASLADKDFTNTAPYHLICRVTNLKSAVRFGTTMIQTPPAVELQAPEHILKLPLYSKIDIWTFGCSLFEEVTSESFIIPSSSSTSEEQQIQSQLGQLIQRLGRLPEDLYYTSSRSRQFVNTDGYLIEPIENQNLTPMPECIFNDAQHETNLDSEIIRPEEREDFVDFLSKMLQWLPDDRASAEELLKHKWLSNAEIPSREYSRGIRNAEEEDEEVDSVADEVPDDFEKRSRRRSSLTWFKTKLMGKMNKGVES